MTTALLIAILLLMIGVALLIDAWLSQRARAMRCESIADAYSQIATQWRKRAEAATTANADRCAAAVLRYLGAK